ncbi:mRNA-decapping enzyme subunit 2 [Savitreella phatthalungensis]
MSTHLSGRAVLHMAGRDTFKYLQSFTTNNLKTPSSQYTAFLAASGRVLYDAFIYVDQSNSDIPACYIDCDASQKDGFVEHLRAFKLRSKFELRAIDAGELSVYAVDEDTLPDGDLANAVSMADPRAPGLGTRLLLPPDSSVLSSLARHPQATYARRRYMVGVPEGAGELASGAALPMESNIDLNHGLNFHKGCYLGQELTVRTYHTGVIRKRIVPVRLGIDGPNNVPASIDAGLTEDNLEIQTFSEGSSLAWTSADGTEAARKRSAGKLLARVGDVGIALVRLKGVQDGLLAKADVDGKLVKPFLPKHWPKLPQVDA